MENGFSVWFGMENKKMVRYHANNSQVNVPVGSPETAALGRLRPQQFGVKLHRRPALFVVPSPEFEPGWVHPAMHLVFAFPFWKENNHFFKIDVNQIDLDTGWTPAETDNNIIAPVLTPYNLVGSRQIVRTHIPACPAEIDLVMVLRVRVP